MRDLFRPDLKARLIAIRDQWLPQRLETLGLTTLPDELASALKAEATLRRFIEDCDATLDHVSLWPDRRLAQLGPVIFEAAQGLLLDQDFGAFPHVTRSNTGLANMLTIATEAGTHMLDVTYATRIYTTRHGAGPLKGETQTLENIRVVDPTNAPNDWQGTLRLAPLDLGVLRHAIAHDLALPRKGVTVNPGLAVTCLDQAKGPFVVTDGNELRKLDPADAAYEIAQATSLPLLAESWGPDRGDVCRRVDVAA